MSSELSERLREHAGCCDHAGLVDDLHAAANLIDRLPVTADGVVVVPGMTVFRVYDEDWPPGVKCEPFVVRYLSEMKLTDKPRSPSIVVDSDPATRVWHGTYSTREAAASARGGEART